jgi:hypothetical protein
MSTDVHKFGLSPKGASVVTYRSSDLRKYQYHSTVDFAGLYFRALPCAGMLHRCMELTVCIASLIDYAFTRCTRCRWAVRDPHLRWLSPWGCHCRHVGHHDSHW